jgi:hypothetical protein
VEGLTRSAKKEGCQGKQYISLHPAFPNILNFKDYIVLFSIYHLMNQRENIVRLNLVTKIICSVFEMLLSFTTMERMTFHGMLNKEQI